MRNCKFSPDINLAFASSLNKRVNQYFKSGVISRTANSEMVMKVVVALLLYLVPYLVIILWAPSSIPLLFGLWILMGLGKACMGTSVMHDSLHGSVSKKKYINNMLGISSTFLGADPTIWKVQHNVLHHTYTNVDEADEDIDSRYVFRFSPNQPLRWFHRYQHLYAVVFYAISTLTWITWKDYIKAFQYTKKGYLKSRPSLPLFIVEITFRKIVYFAVFLALPIYVLPVSAGWVVLMFLAMHFTTGTILSLIFQCAHVMESSSFIDESVSEIPENRLVHQLKTTTNFGVNNKLLFWFSGGLNYQIEHHLFPHICHVHYRKISKIVMSTAREYNLPYYTQKTLGTAIISHFKMLKALGTGRYDLAK